jgi:hypothetical protein
MGDVGVEEIMVAEGDVVEGNECVEIGPKVGGEDNPNDESDCRGNTIKEGVGDVASVVPLKKCSNTSSEY